MKIIFISKGVADCKIVIPENAHIVEKTAAEELVSYIEKALSVKLPIVSEKKLWASASMWGIPNTY